MSNRLDILVHALELVDWPGEPTTITCKAQNNAAHFDVVGGDEGHGAWRWGSIRPREGEFVIALVCLRRDGTPQILNVTIKTTLVSMVMRYFQTLLDTAWEAAGIPHKREPFPF